MRIKDIDRRSNIDSKGGEPIVNNSSRGFTIIHPLLRV